MTDLLQKLHHVAGSARATGAKLVSVSLSWSAARRAMVAGNIGDVESAFALLSVDVANAKPALAKLGSAIVSYCDAYPCSAFALGVTNALHLRVAGPSVGAGDELDALILELKQLADRLDEAARIVESERVGAVLEVA